MSEELMIPGTEPLVHLVARNPIEMQSAQKNLMEWLRHKLVSVDTDINDYQASLDQATKNKWNRTGLRKAVNKALEQKTFYEKLLDAVEAGYTIVPDFPVDVFAIRVEREYAETTGEASRYGQPTVPLESAENLPSGAGDYVSNIPKVSRWDEYQIDAQGSEFTLHHLRVLDLQDVIFPLRAARMEVMSAAAEAMALKVFDQIGICPATKKADPLIIGQILLKTGAYTNKAINFLIAWHLNLNEL